MTEEERIGVAYQRLIKTYLASPHRKKVDLIDRAYKSDGWGGVFVVQGQNFVITKITIE